MDTLIGKIHDLIIKGAKVSTDTRNIDEHSVFFALKGEKFDANDFIDDALDKGAILAVSDRKQLEGAENILIVDDVLVFLQQLAAFHRSTFNIPVIGITGSNGKTTTKELINVVLSKRYNTLCTSGNYNNHIGVPLTLLQLNDKHEIAVIEMGANHMGEIDFLCSLAKPTTGIITNVGKAHIEGFGSVENIITGKTELYRRLISAEGTIFVNGSNEILYSHAKNSSHVTYGNSVDFKVYGETAGAEPFLTVNYYPEKSTLPSNPITIQTQILGAYNFENVMAAIAIGQYFDVAVHDIKDAIESYIPVNSRSQLKKTERNILFMDAYNANPTSMLAALENFTTYKHSPKMVMVGDMLELGESSLEEHTRIFEFILKSRFDKAILVGPQFGQVARSGSQIFHFQDTNEAAEWIRDNEISQYAILVKGSRGIRLEELVKYL